MIKMIGDPGSCHMGNLHKAYDLIRAANDCGLDAVKFQLLTSKQCTGGNINLDWTYLPTLMDLGAKIGIEVFASVFDYTGAAWLKQCGAKSIKFSYSKSDLLNENLIKNIALSFDHVYVSHDTMTPKILLEKYISLYCIAEYPVKYLIDFEGLFPRFDGFSSHTLGIKQDIVAINAGAKIIEKHFTLDDDYIQCPDHNFALRPAQLKQLCDYAK